MTIQAQHVLLADPHSQISTSSALGLDGEVNVQTPVSDISGAVAPLSQQFAPVTQLLAERCALYKRGTRLGRLLVQGREHVPPTLEDLLPGTLPMGDNAVAGSAAPHRTLVRGLSSSLYTYPPASQQEAEFTGRSWR